MTRRLLASYLSLTLLVLLALAIPLGITYARAERQAAVEGLERDTTLIAALFTGELADPFGRQGLAQAYTRQAGARMLIIARDGRLVGDTRPDVSPPQEVLALPEIASARQGRPDSGLRTTELTRQRVLIAAAPILSGDRVVGVVGAVTPSAAVDQRVRRVWLILALAGLGILGAVGLVGLRLAQLVARPVASLRDTARRFAEGDLSARADPETGPVELAELAAAFNEMAVRLGELLASQRAFVADASHQLRTPLTALRLRLENLEAVVPERARDELEACIGETARLGRMVEGLLALARAEGGRMQPAAVDAAAVLRERVGLWRPLSEEQGVRLELEEQAVPAVLALPGALEQVVDNLVDNALREAPAGSSVTLRLAIEEPWVVVHVIDEGPGLPPADLERAFDRFWSGGGRAEAGSGLGLAIVRELVRAAGGQAELLPTDGGGVDARVRLRPALTESLQPPATS